MAPKRLGRPPKFVDDRTGQPIKGNGRPIVGLSLHQPSGRYYATFSEPRFYLGHDFELAKAGLRQWERKEGPPSIIDIKGKSGLDKDKAFLAFSRWHQDHPGEYITFTAFNREDMTEYVTQIPANIFWDKLNALFFENPVAFAKNIRVPAMADLDHIKKPTPSLKLDVVGTMYLDRTGKPLHPRWRRDCKAYWDEFCKITNSKTLADLSADSVGLYREAIYKARKAKKATPRYVNNRFDAIGCVINHAFTEGQDEDNLARIVKLLKMLKRLDSDEDNPQPISREHFEALLKVADTKWKAILLLALNAGFYPIDVAQVEKSHIDLKAKTFSNFRTKTMKGKKKSRRIAVLWDRTVKAIQKYWREEPHTAETVFVSDMGTPYAVKTIQNYFRDTLRESTKGKVPDSVAFNQIRDGSATAAGNADDVDPIQVDMLLGHRPATRDRYWWKKPQIVGKACSAIEKYYFSKQTSSR